MKRMFSPSWLRVIGLCFLPLAMLLSGCGGGGGGGSSGQTNADPTGYYTNTGTIPDLSVSDLQAMIYKNRIIMLSKSQGLYYDGMIAVSGNTITNSGDIIQYQPPGAGAYNVTLSATFNPADHSITGTLNHFGGMQNVAFSLVYASGRAASKVSDIVNDTNHPAWTAPVFNATTDPLSISLSDNTAGAAAITTVSMMTSNIVFGNSNFTGTLTPVAGSLYEVSMPETGSPYGDVTLTGLAALRGNTLVLAASEPITTIAMFAEFQ